jgi:hypothetical protein
VIDRQPNLLRSLRPLLRKYANLSGTKNSKELLDHMRNRRDALDKIAELKGKCQNAKGKRLNQLLDEIARLERDVRGHEKEIMQKWPEMKF